MTAAVIVLQQLDYLCYFTKIYHKTLDKAIDYFTIITWVRS